MQIEGITATGQIRPVLVADDGTVAVSGGVGGGGGGADRELVVTTYRVSTAFAGASVGDVVTETQVIDVSATPSTVGVLWRNQSTSTDFGSAPSVANLTQIEQTGLTDAQLRAESVPVSVSGPLGSASPSSSVSVSLPLDVIVTGPSGQSVINADLLTGNTNGWLDVQGYHSVAIQIIGSAGITSGVVTFECSNDATNAALFAVIEQASSSPITTTATSISANSSRIFLVALIARYIRVRISTAFVGGTVQAVAALSQMTLASPGFAVAASGGAGHSSAGTGNPVRVAGRVNTAVDTTLVAGDACDLFATTSGQLVTKDFATAELDWQNLLTLTTTTAAAAKTAGGASIRNYVTSVEVQNNSATATTFLVQDGATTIWQVSLPASMSLPLIVQFPTPLKGSANTALNVNCGTAGASVVCNIHGYQAV